ncbi:hypothetical protein LCGC14_2297210, partial [marine sediment metagenome]
MAETVTPQKTQIAVKRGLERLARYRRARAMFIKEFVGQYYEQTVGLSGDEPINLIFHTIRTMVPNLVMKTGTNLVTTRYTPQRDYGELLGLALDSLDEQIGLKATLRGWIVAAIFGLGVIKTGLAASGEMLQFGDNTIDPGQVYAKLVSLDDFVIDPTCTSLNESTFIGDRVRVPRQILLDTDGYDHDLVVKLPLAKINRKNKVEDISKRDTAVMEMYTLQDYVDVIELWVPEADAVVTIPDPNQIIFEKYIGLRDYYGPKEGPYTFLSFTPPVPDNPLPVSSVSLWYDIHRMANRIFKKIMDQSDRQKDILIYPPSEADAAQDVVDSKDGDTVMSSNPKEINVVSFGGQNRNNEVMLQEAQMWYNYVSGNPDQMAGNMTKGTGAPKESATRSQIIQSNSQVGLEDARDILYDSTAEVNRKMAWYLHTDPLIKIPLTKRATGGKQIQLFLTPEQRQGDFFRFTFKIKARSMSRLDPAIRSKRMVEFAVNILPGLINAAMIAMQMGQRFNIQRAVTDLAEELGILDDVM